MEIRTARTGKVATAHGWVPTESGNSRIHHCQHAPPGMRWINLHFCWAMGSGRLFAGWHFLGRVRFHGGWGAQHSAAFFPASAFQEEHIGIHHPVSLVARRGSGERYWPPGLFRLKMRTRKRGSKNAEFLESIAGRATALKSSSASGNAYRVYQIFTSALKSTPGDLYAK